MITVQRMGWPGLDLVEVENLRKWISYMPKCYKDRLNSGEFEEQQLRDDLTLVQIKKLYALIRKIDGKLSLKQRHFNLEKPHSLEDEREYKRLIENIPTFNISYYASIKLTEDEKKLAYDFMRSCDKENSKEMMNYAENYQNFFVGSYMRELLIHHPESDYITSTKNIGISVHNANERLNKEMKKIKQREQASWQYANRRFR